MKIEDIQMKPFKCHQSSIACAHGCERCWFFQERWGVILRGVKVKEGATLGTIYHKFQHLGPGHEKEVKAWVTKIQSDLMLRVDKGEDLDGEMVRLANLLTTLYHKAEAMVHLFWERYPTPSYLKTIGTEIKHTMSLPRTYFRGVNLEGMVLEGIIDKLVQDTTQGNIWIRDHKSTGMNTLDVIFAGFTWSTQGRMYRILAEDYCRFHQLGQYKGNYTVRGFILDGIMKPGIKLCKKDEKNAMLWKCSVEEAYLRRVKEWYDEKETGAIQSQSIVYNEPLYPPELMYELCKMQDLGSRGNNPDNYLRDPSRFHCFLYDTPCIYHDLCSSPKSRWSELFDVKYKIKENEK